MPQTRESRLLSDIRVALAWIVERAQTLDDDQLEKVARQTFVKSGHLKGLLAQAGDPNRRVIEAMLRARDRILADNAPQDEESDR